jgi:hypothetical protein
MFEEGLSGAKLHLWDGFAQPRSRSEHWGSLRFKRYLEAVMVKEQNELQENFGAFVCSRWNRDNEASNAAVTLHVFKVVYEVNAEKMNELARVQTELFSHECNKKATRSESTTNVVRLIDWPQANKIAFPEAAQKERKVPLVSWKLPHSAVEPDKQWPNIRMRPKVCCIRFAGVFFLNKNKTKGKEDPVLPLFVMGGQGPPASFRWKMAVEPIKVNKDKHLFGQCCFV